MQVKQVQGFSVSRTVSNFHGLREKQLVLLLRENELVRPLEDSFGTFLNLRLKRKGQEEFLNLAKKKYTHI